MEMDQAFERSGMSETRFLLEFRSQDFFSYLVTCHVALLKSTVVLAMECGTGGWVSSFMIALANRLP